MTRKPKTKLPKFVMRALTVTFSNFIVVAITVGLDFEDYGGEYHCWLQVNKPIVFFVLISTVLLVILTFTAIEAAGK